MLTCAFKKVQSLSPSVTQSELVEKKTFPKNLKNGADKRREIRFYQQVIMQNKIESFALSNLSVPQNLQNYFSIFQFN